MTPGSYPMLKWPLLFIHPASWARTHSRALFFIEAF